METLKFKTNINCGSCVAKVTPFLNADDTIKTWQVDTASPDKILSVQGTRLSKEGISATLSDAGFKIFDEVKVNGIKSPVTDAFWSNRANWKRASFNTLNCLVGCSLGDFGTIIYMQYNHPHTSMWLMMGIAIIAGLSTSILLETILLKVKEGFAWIQALTTAFSMSFISMLAMELSENATDYVLTGGGNIPLSDSFYWMALSISLVAGFAVPLPYNYYKLQKYGKACH